jgi:Ras-related protein Rab-1A
MKFIETSAKNAKNVEEAFMTMTKEIVNLKKKQKEQEDTNKKPNIQLGQGTEVNNKKGGCCGGSK